MSILQWLSISGVTLAGILLGIWKIGKWILSKLPPAKERKKYHELCKEENNHLTCLNNWLYELQTNGVDAVFTSLQEVGIPVEDAKHSTLYSVLQDSLCKVADDITSEAMPCQIAHNRKIRQLEGEQP